MSPEPIRILFVEDSSMDSELIIRTLKKAGLSFESEQVMTIPTLRQALERKFDIVLSDFHLPGFSAFEVIREVSLKNSDIPVIVLSGAIQEEDAVDLLR